MCILSVLFLISQSFVNSMQNDKFCLLPQTAGAMLNTTSQLLTVRRIVPKAARVQNTDRVLSCERAHVLRFTFCYARRKH
jgi:hypothetical protein